MAAVMKEVSAPRAAARKTTTASAAAGPFAQYLDKVDESTAKLIRTDKPIREPETDPIARAIRQMGGITRASEKTSISCPQLLEIIFGGDGVDASDCVLIERGCLQKVMCEEMRPDLLWFRDAGNEVVGFAQRIDSQPADLDAAIKARFADMGAPAGNAATDKVTPFLTDPRLEELTKAALETVRVISSVKDHFVRGVVVVGPDASEGWTPWGKHGVFTALSDAARNLDKITGDVLVAVHRANNTPPDTTLDRSAVMRELFASDDDTPYWQSVALTDACRYLTVEVADQHTAERIAQGCDNLLHTFEHGLAGLATMQWHLSVSDAKNNVEPWAVSNVLYLTKAIAEYAIELRGLKDAADTRLKHLDKSFGTK